MVLCWPHFVQSHFDIVLSQVSRGRAITQSGWCVTQSELDAALFLLLWLLESI